MINLNKEKPQHSLLHTPEEEKKANKPILAIVFAIIIVSAAAAIYMSFNS